jgi:hypothetical protein
MALHYAQEVLRQLGLKLGMHDFKLLGKVLAQRLGINAQHFGDTFLRNRPASHHLDHTGILVNWLVDWRPQPPQPPPYYMQGRAPDEELN